MKIISRLLLEIKRGHLPELAEQLHVKQCDLQKMVRLEESRDWELYDLEIIYGLKQHFDGVIEFLESATEYYRIKEKENLLENSLQGGMLRFKSRMPVENKHDLELKLLGASHYIKEKILQGQGSSFSGVSSNIANFAFIKERVEVPESVVYDHYTDAERDSAIIAQFSEISAYPIVAKYQFIEGIIKCIKTLEPGFAAFRLQFIEDLEDIAFYEQISSEVSKPVLSVAGDELPLTLLVEILHLFKKNRFQPNESNIGIIGIGVSAIRMTRLLLSMGCLRVLGYDNNEKLMHVFEKSGGLATTAENIFTNSDVILLMNNHFTIDEFHKIRSGQLIVSLIDEDDLETGIIKERGVKEYIPRENIEPLLLLPGLVQGILKSGKKYLDDKAIMDLAMKIHQLRLVHPETYNFFGDVHSRIADFLSS